MTYLDLVGSVQETLFQFPATAVPDTPHKPYESVAETN